MIMIYPSQDIMKFSMKLGCTLMLCARTQNKFNVVSMGVSMNFYSFPRPSLLCFYLLFSTLFKPKFNTRLVYNTKSA